MNATSSALASRLGSELPPLAGLPLGSVLTATVMGEHDATVVQVLRIKTMPPLFGSFVSKLFEIDAKATYCPVVLVEGPTVVSFSPSVPFSQFESPPQIPAFACEPSGARSTSTGSPSR